MEISKGNRFVSLAKMNQTIIIILTFFIIFSINLPGLPSFLTSTRISSVLFLLWTSIYNNGIIKYDNTPVSYYFHNILKLYFWLFCYSIILLFINGRGSGLTSAAFYIDVVITWSILWISYHNCLNSKEKILDILVWVALLQSIIIVMCIINPEIRSFINNTFNGLSFWNINRNVDEMYKLGYSFGIGCMTSTGSLQLAIGQIASLAKINQNKTNNFIDIFCFILISIASILVSRTGLFLTLMFLGFNHKILKLKWYKYLVLALIVFSAIYISNFDAKEFSEQRLNRYIYLFNNGLYESYFYSYFNSIDTYIPELSAETILGTGILSGISGNGTKVNVDGGYLRLYVAVGLVCSIIMYMLILRYILKIKKYIINNKMIVYICILTLYLGEIKEFICVSNYIGYIFLILYTVQNERRAKYEI